MVGDVAWAAHSHQVFGGQTRFTTSGDMASPPRWDIWSNTLALIASHPWFGVGFGDFNFAWTLTPFPDRPTEFFDHTHNLILNFLVEMGVPLATLVLALMLYALWQALRNAIRDGREPGAAYPVQRAAFVIVFLVAVHSMLEYPLWYTYFLLPTAFAFGLCLERPVASEAAGRAGDDERGNATRPYVIAAMFLILGGTLGGLRLHAGRRHLRAARRRRLARAAHRRRAQEHPLRPPRRLRRRHRRRASGHA